MFKISIISPGKNQESWLEESLAIYEKRLLPYTEIHWHFPKDDKQLEALLAKQSFFYALDPQGASFTSEKFSHFLMTEGEQRFSRLYFVIGGAEGLPEAIKSRAARLISLSPLTFTHQFARLILLEQLYRAFTIYHRLPYHK